MFLLRYEHTNLGKFFKIIVSFYLGASSFTILTPSQMLASKTHFIFVFASESSYHTSNYIMVQNFEPINSNLSPIEVVTLLINFVLIEINLSYDLRFL